MMWLALRQSRTELVALAVILAGMLLFLVPTGLEKAADFESSGLSACVNAGQPCPDLRDRLTGDYDRLGAIVSWFHFVPAIAGILMAAPAIVDFEQRTYRLAWTQSVTRNRWFISRLAVAVAGALVFALAMTIALTWWHHPLDRSATVAGRDLGSSFGFEGVVPAAYTLLALAIALAAGVVSKRLLVAVGASAIGFLALRVAAEFIFRVGLTSDVSFDAEAGQLAENEATRDMERFWTVQAVEGSLILLLSAGLLAFTYWYVRKRA